MASRATNTNTQVGTGVEQYREAERDGEHAPDAWFDLDDGGTLVEVKSTQQRLSYSDRRGRFRLWRNQHENMVDHGGEYDFVVLEQYDDDDDDLPDAPDTEAELRDLIAFEKTLSAAEVDDIIEAAAASWTGAGSHVMGDQIKLSWSEVFPEQAD